MFTKQKNGIFFINFGILHFDNQGFRSSFDSTNKNPQTMKTTKNNLLAFKKTSIVELSKSDCSKIRGGNDNDVTITDPDRSGIYSLLCPTTHPTRPN